MPPGVRLACVRADALVRAQGVAESEGFMVNYRYDMETLEENSEVSARPRARSPPPLVS